MRVASTPRRSTRPASVLHTRNGKSTSPDRPAGSRHDYKTLDMSYTESVLWAFKAALRQGPGLPGSPRPALLLERPHASGNHELKDGRRGLGPHRQHGDGGPAPRDRAARDSARPIWPLWTAPGPCPPNSAVAVGPIEVLPRQGRGRPRGNRGRACPRRPDPSYARGG